VLDRRRRTLQAGSDLWTLARDRIVVGEGLAARQESGFRDWASQPARTGLKQAGRWGVDQDSRVIDAGSDAR